MNSKYEISIWTDIFDEELQRFVEIKEIVIGSNTMTSESRARNPKLINNINGTNKFSFDLYYRYIDTRTGEEVENPYVPYLVNERKIKVLWKDVWYDLLVKQIREDQANRIFTYTCEDCYITELSRSGFELEFATELENNIGTAEELVNAVIKNTDWKYDPNSKPIYQFTEQPVYESQLLVDIEAELCPDNNLVTLPAGAPILLYYNFAPNIEDLQNDIQICCANGPFETDLNEMLVTNGNCYNLSVTWDIDISINRATAKIGSNNIFTINFDSGLSSRYRAERYVQSNKMVYNDIVNRYVNEYTVNGEKVYGYSATEYNDALVVVNLVTNPNNFKNLSGWTGEKLLFKIWPAFDTNTDLTTYKAKSYLHLSRGQTYTNTGIQNNRAYIPNGFIEGDNYMVRIRALKGSSTNPDYTPEPNVDPPYLKTTETFGFRFVNGNDEEIFGSPSPVQWNPDTKWLEYQFKCVKSCSYNDLLTAFNSCNIQLIINSTSAFSDIWIEDIQFFPIKYGVKATGDPDQPKTDLTIIYPNEMATQSIAQVVWKYFYAEQDPETTIDTLQYCYTSTEPWNKAIPETNDYQSYAMIEESQSNRFNILQSIAEKFKAWIRFRVEHDPVTGEILYDENNNLEKYVGVFTETGQETGIGFVYGIDLKGVTRDIKSDKISTKTIVMQNENEFGKNGFCTIARSRYNYPLENTIYNFDYYIQHGLLQRDILQNDLYNTTNDQYIQYYIKLHKLNQEYALILDALLNKNSELTRQKATQTVYQQYLSAAENELENIKDSIIKLAGTDKPDPANPNKDPWKEAQAYAKSHANNTKVQSLMNDYSITEQSIAMYNTLNKDIQTSLDSLNSYIDKHRARQNEIIDELRSLNTQFYIKYSRFIQEGTWESQDYWDDDLYYLDALQVSYESSRPQISYDINVMRISDLDDYSSKVFNLGDISFIQDVKYFGYQDDGITPYKEKVILTEITSNFDTPDKDTIKVQNYKSQFDDLFQRITAATQNLEFSEGKYARAANIMQDDGTIKSSVIQNTFDSNKDLIYGAQNESVTMNNTGITVVDDSDSSKLLKITSGGVFVSADGGNTWKNAVRGDGINTELLTAGRINTEEITVFNGDYPSFRWDSNGLNAYSFDPTTRVVDTHQSVRFDQYGIYGIKTSGDVVEFVPTSANEIYNKASFGLLWDKFFLKSNNNQTGDNFRSFEISTTEDLVIKAGEDPDTAIKRVQIGRIDGSDNYGIIVRNQSDEIVFRSDEDGAEIAGWQLKKGMFESVSETGQNIQIQSNGAIGSYGHEPMISNEVAYEINTSNVCYARQVGSTDPNKQNIKIDSGTLIKIFASSVGTLQLQYQVKGDYDQIYDNPPSSIITPIPPDTVQFVIGNGTTNYIINNSTSTISFYNSTHNTITETNIIEDETVITKITTYTYNYKSTIKVGSTLIAEIIGKPGKDAQRFIPESTTAWYIDSEGQAVFHNIEADGGTIAGWFIDREKIYQTYNGKKDGSIKTQLASAGASVTNDNKLYSIITDAINASMATMGGVLMAGGLVNGYNLTQINATAEAALSKAKSALTQIKNLDQVYAKKQHTHSMTCNRSINYENPSKPGSSTTIYGFSTNRPNTNGVN